MRVLRILGLALLALGGVVALGAAWLLAPATVPEHSDFVVDRAGLEAAATEIAGALPVAVRHHEIARASLPHAAVFSGTDFSPHTMVHGAYQVLYPDGSYVLVDAGFGPAVHAQMAARGSASYDAEAFATLAAALPRARRIVLTHEHPDHIQGLAEAADPSALAPRLFLNAAQHANPSARELLPAALLAAVEPVAVAGVRAVAPGVAVQAAPGHTPGSQLVWVKRAAGPPLLLIGDVAWHMDALRELRYRPRLITDLFLGEDRGAVMAQFRTLHGMLDDPSLVIVSSHDPEQLRALQTAGTLGAGLAPGVGP